MEKINIAELLKDCPKGMELDCSMYDNVVLDTISDGSIYPIKIKTPEHFIFLTKNGCYSDNKFSKCVIFPKGKTTWEGFQRPFMDGDIVVTKTSNNFIFYSIYKGVENRKVLTHVDYHFDSNRLMFNDNLSSLCFINEIVEQRFATEEEKAKLFDAIKSHGYEWNTYTKTLERLIEPKFKVGDRVVKKGDISTPVSIVRVGDKYYYHYSNTEGTIGLFPIAEQDDWELVPTKFDINTLKPFDKVLVRDNNEQFWTCDWFSFHDTKQVYPFACVGHYVSQCIPYEGNQHLLGTTNDCEEFYKNWE